MRLRKKPLGDHNISVRLVQLGKHRKDVIIALRKRGVKIAQSEFSRYLNGVENPPKSELVLSEADNIIAEWEKDVKQNG